MDGLDSAQDLVAETQRGGQAEGSSGLGAAQLGKVFGLELHDHVVEALVAPAPDEPTHVLATCRTDVVGVGRTDLVGVGRTDVAGVITGLVEVGRTGVHGLIRTDLVGVGRTDKADVGRTDMVSVGCNMLQQGCSTKRGLLLPSTNNQKIGNLHR